MKDDPAQHGQDDHQNGERLCRCAENAEGSTDEYARQDMRRSPGERRRDIDGIEPPDRHPQHTGKERNESTDARGETCEKNTLITVAREKGFAGLDQFGVSIQRPEAEDLAVVSMAEPE